MMPNTSTHGFAALVSVLIISAILVAITFETSAASFFARADLFDSENKARSESAARGCIEAAILRLAENPSYQPSAGGDAVAIDSNTDCVIVALVPLGSDLLISSRAQVHSTVTSLTATVHPRSASEALLPEVSDYKIESVTER